MCWLDVRSVMGIYYLCRKCILQSFLQSLITFTALIVWLFLRKNVHRSLLWHDWAPLRSLNFMKHDFRYNLAMMANETFKHNIMEPFIKFDKVVKNRSLSACDIIRLIKTTTTAILGLPASGMQKLLKMGPPFRINR